MCSLVRVPLFGHLNEDDTCTAHNIACAKSRNQAERNIFLVFSLPRRGSGVIACSEGSRNASEDTCCLDRCGYLLDAVVVLPKTLKP